MNVVCSIDIVCTYQLLQSQIQLLKMLTVLANHYGTGDNAAVNYE
jgi:hypothetical protein